MFAESIRCLVNFETDDYTIAATPAIVIGDMYTFIYSCVDEPILYVDGIFNDVDVIHMIVVEPQYSDAVKAVTVHTILACGCCIYSY